MSAAVSLAPFERSRDRGSNLVYKSGPLFMSSKGLGWKLWKRRWFILTNTSLVFFKNDPNAILHRGSDMNLTLGCIDLNNSGSVLVRAEKKLLTVLFADERAYTLKAETIEDVDEWKDALERAFEAAPNAALVVGHHTAFRGDSHDPLEGSAEQGRDRIIGRPIMLALEDVDGSPSFLEKALSFIERHGVRVEGILRQCADVDDVDRRVKEYEQGRIQFTPDEDAHVIGDCIKHLLRELPSSPVSAPCCTALLEAHRLEGKESRHNGMHTAIFDTFPEPNRHLLQRVLRMMRAVSAHAAENRMTVSAVAACMAPLLLRPLLAGECELEEDSDATADNETQLLAATAAANNAQAIVTMLLEDYDSIFEEDRQQGPLLSNRYGDMEASASNASHVVPDVDGGYQDAPNNLQDDIEMDAEQALSGAFSESSRNLGSNPFHHKAFEHHDNDVSAGFGSSTTCKGGIKPWHQSVNLGSDEQSNVAPLCLENGGGLNISKMGSEGSQWGGGTSPHFSNTRSGGNGSNLKVKPCASTSSVKRSSLWGFSSANTKTLNMDVHDSSGEEDLTVHHLEFIRNDLWNRIAKEAKVNASLQARLERKKQELHERRCALEQDVARLWDQLQTEPDLRAAWAIGLGVSAAQLSATPTFDSKTQAEMEEIAAVEADVKQLKQKVADLHLHLKQQYQCWSLVDSSEYHQCVKNLQSEQGTLQQELNVTLSLCHQEKQRNEQMEGEAGQQEEVAELEHVLGRQRNVLTEAKEALMTERELGANLQCHSSPPSGISVAGDQ